jgi:hypothetical protein
MPRSCCSSDVNVAFTPYDQAGDGSQGASLVTEVLQGRIHIRIEARTGTAMIELSRTHDLKTA